MNCAWRHDVQDRTLVVDKVPRILICFPGAVAYHVETKRAVNPPWQGDAYNCCSQWCFHWELGCVDEN